MRRKALAVAAVAAVASAVLASQAAAAPKLDTVFGGTFLAQGSLGTDESGFPVPPGNFSLAVAALSPPHKSGVGKVWFDFQGEIGPGRIDVECVSVYEPTPGDVWARISGKLRTPLDALSTPLVQEQLAYGIVEIHDLGPNPSAPDPYFQTDRWYAAFFKGQNVVFDPADDCRVDTGVSQVGPGALLLEDWPTPSGDFVLHNGK
jgi:hypothetical protein